MTGYGRGDDEWDRLAETGLAFLIERARLKKMTTYTELNATLCRRTGLRGFDFEQEKERAAMGHLLGLIVDRNHPTTTLMISALVQYLNANDAGPGFYALAVELGPMGIRVNTICPTFIVTEMTKPYFEDARFRGWVLSKIKLGRLGEIEDLMGPVVFLASDASRLVTGAALMVDGGWTAE